MSEGRETKKTYEVGEGDPGEVNTSGDRAVGGQMGRRFGGADTLLHRIAF